MSAFTEREILEDTKNRITFKLLILDIKDELDDNEYLSDNDRLSLTRLCDENYATYERIDLYLYICIFINKLDIRVPAVKPLLEYYSTYFTNLSNSGLRARPAPRVPDHLKEAHRELEEELSNSDNQGLFTKFLVEKVLIKPYPYNPYKKCCNLGFIEETELNYNLFMFLVMERDFTTTRQLFIYYNCYAFPFGRSLIGASDK